MIRFLILIACFTHIYTYEQCLLKDPNNQCCLTAIGKILKFMKDSGGLLTFTKQKFVFQPRKDWVNFAKVLIESKQSETLASINTGEIDELYKAVKDYLSPLTILSINVQAAGPDLLDRKKMDWKFGNSEVVGPGVFTLKKGSKPFIKSEKAKLRFEFNVGPKYWESSTASKEICAEFGKKKRCKVNLGDPFLEIEKIPDVQRLTYKIIVYHAEAKGTTRNKERRALNLVRGIAEVLASRVQSMKVEEYLGLPYRYSIQQEAVQLEDAFDTLYYIRRWIEPKDCSNVIVNLYGLMKAYLKNPYVTSVDPNIPHSPMEFKAKNRENNILFVDKFMNSNDLSGYPKNYVNKGKKNDKMLKVVEQRHKTIFDEVKENGLSEMNAPKLNMYIIHRLLQPYFKRTREETARGRPRRDLNASKKFLRDKYFAGRENTDFKPSFRKLGPPYGIKKTYRSNMLDPQDECTEDQQEPLIDYETPPDECTDQQEPLDYQPPPDECTDQQELLDFQPPPDECTDQQELLDFQTPPDECTDQQEPFIDYEITQDECTDQQG